MIGIQIERDQPVSNTVFLTVPSSEVGLGEFDGFPCSAGGNPRDEFREALRRGIRWGLPSFLPELHLVRSQVSPPISIGDLIGPFTKHQLAPIADEGHLYLHKGIKRIGSKQCETSRCHFTDQLPTPVVAPGLPFTHLFE